MEKTSNNSDGNSSSSSSSSPSPPSSSKASSPSAVDAPSDMPADISDLRSSDLLQTLPGMIDIDRIFADFQAGAEQGHPPSNNNNTIQNNNNNGVGVKSRKVIIGARKPNR